MGKLCTKREFCSVAENFAAAALQHTRPCLDYYKMCIVQSREHVPVCITFLSPFPLLIFLYSILFVYSVIIRLLTSRCHQARWWRSNSLLLSLTTRQNHLSYQRIQRMQVRTTAVEFLVQVVHNHKKYNDHKCATTRIVIMYSSLVYLCKKRRR